MILFDPQKLTGTGNLPGTVPDIAIDRFSINLKTKYYDKSMGCVKGFTQNGLQTKFDSKTSIL